MKTIVGLGSAGCNLADEFAKYPQYKIYKIDTGLKGLKKDGIYALPRQKSHEDYEAKCPSMKNFFKDVNGEVLFIVGGSGTVSGAMLNILQHLKRCKISIMYIKPDLEFLSETKRLQERVVSGVLQEYARSAVFERIYLVNNVSVESVVGEVTVKDYYKSLNKAIVSSFHMINVFNHSKPVMTTFSTPIQTARISTFGFFDLESGEEKMFFPLDYAREKLYYYGINSETLENDGKLLKKIKKKAKEKVENKLKVSYGIYPTSYEENYGYILSHATLIQP